MSLVGAVYGALLVNAGKTLFSESFPDLWLFLMAALFIGVTMAFPMGLAGLWEDRIKPWWRRRRLSRQEEAQRLAAAHAAYPDVLPPRTRTSANGPAAPHGGLHEGMSGQRA
jgi:urea transport system permease protein